MTLDLFHQHVSIAGAAIAATAAVSDTGYSISENAVFIESKVCTEHHAREDQV